jgi:putative glutamine amidotransferase
MGTALERARWSVWDQEALLLPRSYAAAVQRAGGMALMLPLDEQLVQSPDEVLELLDGLMLAGGADIDPSFYGASRHPQTAVTMPARDAFEIALVRGAVARDMPVLGICRGMQLINVALGGTLCQHLPERFGHSEHLRAIGSFDGADHDVIPVPDSLAERVIGPDRHVTKSHHHQGLERLGEGLRVGAVSPIDDLPEAIELPGHGFVLGVQWHPEADPESPIIPALVEAAREALVGA